MEGKDGWGCAGTILLVYSAAGALAFILNRDAFSLYDLCKWIAAITTLGFPAVAGFTVSDWAFDKLREYNGNSLSKFLNNDLLHIVGLLFVGLIGSVVLWLVLSQTAFGAFGLWVAGIAVGFAVERILTLLA